MNDIEEIKQFRAADGSTFNYMCEAEEYNEILKKCDDISVHMMTVPDEDIDFVNGIGWIQHTPGTKDSFGTLLLDIINETIEPETPSTKLTNKICFSVASNEIDCITKLIYRWMSMDNFDKEYGQPYFANNPKEVRGGQIN